MIFSSLNGSFDCLNLGQDSIVMNMTSIFLVIVILVYDTTANSDVVNNSKVATNLPVDKREKEDEMLMNFTSFVYWK